MAIESLEEIIPHFNSQSEKAISSFRKDLQKVRTGRASSGLIEGILVEHYGAKTPIGHLGQISTPEARLILIQVYDATAAASIEKAIQNAGLGLNPATEGSTIRINVPQLTEESRKEIIRHLSKMAEDIRIGIRNHRRDANESVKSLEKSGAATKDDVKRSLDEIQKRTNAYIEEVEKCLKTKEAECMEV